MSKYLAALILTAGLISTANGQTLKTINTNTPADLQGYFKYTGKDIPLVSGHRGCHIERYPENSIEAMEEVLKHTPAFFEIDPRLTKDSVVVLLHDATLDRTTTGKGKLSDYTWEEIKKLKLKDKLGNVTPYRIPTLAEAIEWARGKTILNLDKKDVPLTTTAKIIREHKAGAFVMVTVHNAKQAKFYYDDDNNRMMSAFVKTDTAMQEYEAAGIPWKNMIAYIGPENKPDNKKMFDLLHSRGVMCMISAAPTYDKLADSSARANAYRETFTQGADILESDLPIETAAAIQTLLPPASAKKKYFSKTKGRK
ncbi:glycerophosphodiester phosphodiesterase family protein [Paraflavitalea sp. CAU 1676]|uniref:glycerophosphodiester phosphodiesterase family protein n=1 Tax=Paraflavitalea sp. CAU 1676 TaxID=3032598 RepID=UPI0023D9CEB7|nr:glycerophosphodiester phosphodiesterase family protein [Paraflavitalea sp. CAU 1676]MDF2191154.1 glycerophosphodiester phosphodiesterase family protein [Paraflavitalea sp. CAU 1676]